MISSLLKAWPDKEWCYEGLSENPGILEYALEHPEKPWNYAKLSENLYLTINHILKNPDKPWNQKMLENISLKDVLERPDDTIFCIYLLPYLSDLTIKNVLKTPTNWDFWTISMHPGIKIEDVIDHPELLWNYKTLMQNPNLIEFLEKRNEKEKLPFEIDYYRISFNIGITYSFIKKHIKKINFKNLSYNKCNFKDEVMNEIRRLEFSSKINKKIYEYLGLYGSLYINDTKEVYNFNKLNRRY